MKLFKDKIKKTHWLKYHSYILIYNLKYIGVNQWTFVILAILDSKIKQQIFSVGGTGQSDFLKSAVEFA